MTGRGPINVRVKVTPAAPREFLREGKDGRLHIAVTEKASQGVANRRVRELVAMRFGVSPKKVRIIRGASLSGKILVVYAR